MPVWVICECGALIGDPVKHKLYCPALAAASLDPEPEEAPGGN